MNKPLKAYVKTDAEKLDGPTVTSVTLERKHMDFVRRHNLNLSKLIRDFLSDLMKAHDSGSPKKPND